MLVLCAIDPSDIVKLLTNNEMHLFFVNFGLQGLLEMSVGYSSTFSLFVSLLL